MSYKPNIKQTRPTNSVKKRTPRTVILDESINRNKPALISEAFNLKNFDIIGKIDDMRVLTNELSVMARQLEQWVSVIHTVGMAFKDTGILKELVKAVSSLNVNNNSNYNSSNNNQNTNQNFSPFPFPFFQNTNASKDTQTKESPNRPVNNINFAEILNNPVFKELVNSLFSQTKK